MKKRQPMRVQSLIFNKDDYTKTSAKKWAREHGYRYGKVDETSQSWRLRQFAPSEKLFYRTITFKPGLSAVVAKAKGNAMKCLCEKNPTTAPGGEPTARNIASYLSDSLLPAYAGWNIKIYADERFGTAQVFVTFASVPEGSSEIDALNSRHNVMVSIGAKRGGPRWLPDSPAPKSVTADQFRGNAKFRAMTGEPWKVAVYVKNWFLKNRSLLTEKPGEPYRPAKGAVPMFNPTPQGADATMLRVYEQDGMLHAYDSAEPVRKATAKEKKASAAAAKRDGGAGVIRVWVSNTTLHKCCPRLLSLKENPTCDCANPTSMVRTQAFRAGQRVQLHPGTDRWMMGDRYGVVTKVGRKNVSVKLDKSGKTIAFRPDLIMPVEENPNPARKHFLVINKAGYDMGIYQGADEREAIKAMAHDAGYKSVAQATKHAGPFRGVEVPRGALLRHPDETMHYRSNPVEENPANPSRSNWALGPPPGFPPGARVLVHGEVEAIVKQYFPEGSTSYLYPHYVVDFVDGDKNVKVPLLAVGIESKRGRRAKKNPGPDLDKICASFPPTFGLRGHSGTFRVSRQASYINNRGQPVIYTQIKEGDKWLDFAKASEAELRMELVPRGAARNPSPLKAKGKGPYLVVRDGFPPTRYDTAYTAARALQGGSGHMYRMEGRNQRYLIAVAHQGDMTVLMKDLNADERDAFEALPRIAAPGLQPTRISSRKNPMRGPNENLSYGTIPIELGYDALNIYQRYWWGQGDPLYAMLSRRGNSVSVVKLTVSEDELSRFESVTREILHNSKDSDEKRTAKAYLPRIKKWWKKAGIEHNPAKGKRSGGGAKTELAAMDLLELMVREGLDPLAPEWGAEHWHLIDRVAATHRVQPNTLMERALGMRRLIDPYDADLALRQIDALRAGKPLPKAGIEHNPAKGKRGQCQAKRNPTTKEAKANPVEAPSQPVLVNGSHKPRPPTIQGVREVQLSASSSGWSENTLVSDLVEADTIIRTWMTSHSPLKLDYTVRLTKDEFVGSIPSVSETHLPLSAHVLRTWRTWAGLDRPLALTDAEYKQKLGTTNTAAFSQLLHTYSPNSKLH